MTDSVSFKAYLKRDKQEVEVRRFGIDGGAATNYVYLRGKIQTMFPSVQSDNFSIFWQDTDKDYVSIGSDEELLEALTSSIVQPFKLYIRINAEQKQNQGGSNRQSHSGVTCDGCQGPVNGHRYKCVTCPDYDLCSSCEFSGLHPEHFMLRISTPFELIEHPKFFRKFFGHPHKFHKRHGWSRMGNTQTGSGRCSFSRREGPVQGESDMFDFSALMEFMNNFGINATGNNEVNEPPTNAQATSSSHINQTNQTSQAHSVPQEHNQNTSRPKRTGPQATDYLNGIGQAITAFLDPFGVDVTFDVRTKDAGAKGSAPSNSPQENDSASFKPAFIPSSNSQEPCTAKVAASSNIHRTEASSIAPANNNEVIPLPAPMVPISESSPTPVRRNSDDWTLLNRESPTHSDGVITMDIDESQGVKAKTPTLYPELLKDTPSAPSEVDTVQLENERLRIQEAIDKMRNMGFNFDTTVLHELLKRQNCDIASVLEMIFNNANKK